MKKYEEMLAKATQAYEKAYAPYSKFQVGVCLRAENDALFSGCNVENAAYASTLCAEAVAIGALITGGARSIKEMVIVTSGKILSTPCGACRQRLSEFAATDTVVHLYNTHGDHKTVTMEALFPFPFGPKSLEKS